ncbi:MAG: hypothetical protein R3E83_21410 [Burkholderiaceae bacterium]
MHTTLHRQWNVRVYPGLRFYVQELEQLTALAGRHQMKRGPVTRAEIWRMRHHGRASGLCHVADSEEFADPAHLDHAGLHEADLTDRTRKALAQAGILAAGHGHAEITLQRGQGDRVIGWEDRLLDPVQTHVTHGRRTTRLFQRPVAIDVGDQMIDARGHTRTHRDRIVFDLVQLDAAIALGDRTGRELGDLSRLAVAHQARVGGKLATTNAAQALGKRHTGTTRVEITQGQIDRRHRESRDPEAPCRCSLRINSRQK